MEGISRHVQGSAHKPQLSVTYPVHRTEIGSQDSQPFLFSVLRSHSTQKVVEAHSFTIDTTMCSERENLIIWLTIKIKHFENLHYSQQPSRTFFLFNGIRWPLFLYSHQQFTVLIIIFVQWTQLLKYWTHDTNYMLWSILVFRFVIVLCREPSSVFNKAPSHFSLCWTRVNFINLFAPYAKQFVP